MSRTYGAVQPQNHPEFDKANPDALKLHGSEQLHSEKGNSAIVTSHISEHYQPNIHEPELQASEADQTILEKPEAPEANKANLLEAVGQTSRTNLAKPSLTKVSQRIQ